MAIAHQGVLSSPAAAAASPIQDDSVHQWYRIIMGFDWKLVQSVIDRLEVGPQHLVLDPFCGAGTTLVQCKKNGIRSVGIDANPVCTLASKVKTSWHLNSKELTELLDRIVDRAANEDESGDPEDDLALEYLKSSGMIERGWLSLHKAKAILGIRAAIDAITMKPAQRSFFKLALVSALVGRIADIKFGPEVYCLSEPRRTAVVPSFRRLASTMIEDIENNRELSRRHIGSDVVLGDSRQAGLLKRVAPTGVDFVITSPPYPAEHDYTRNTRLELVVLQYVLSVADLRQLKRRMLRCHTKGIYKGDSDAHFAAKYPVVRRVAESLDHKAKTRTDGFSRLYGTMVREYFGGMISHLRGTMQTLRPGGRCAYVVRDQKSLLGEYIDTPGILVHIATSRAQGFRLDEVIEWKKSKGTTGTRVLREKILVFSKPRH